MKETFKTVGMFAAAAALLLVALVARPKVEAPQSRNIGGAIHSGFTDPLAVAKVEIIEYDTTRGEASGIVAAKKSSGWVIQSRHDYPADAQHQLQKSTTLLIGLEKLGVESTESADHAKYGVVDPQKAKPGDDGVGKLVRFSNEAGAALAELIIGKELPGDAGAEPQAAKLYYVRIPGEDSVLTTRLGNTSALTTRFEDWVERDLLSFKNGYQFNSAAVKRVVMDLHRVEDVGVGVRPIKGPIYQFIHQHAGGQEWADANGSEFKPAKHEQINQTALNNFRTAMADLKITDVEPKPAVLATNLLAGNEFAGEVDTESVRSLRKKGFWAARLGNETNAAPVILSNQGETRVGMDDGVEYVLRFGEAIAKGGAADKNATADSRYIYILARFNEALLDKPVLVLPDVNATKGPDRNATQSAEGNATNLDKLREATTKLATEEHAKKLKEYTDKADNAQRRVRELNQKYARWYYVISEDVYKKLHLDRAALVQETTIQAAHLLVAHKGAKGADEKITRTDVEAKQLAETLLKQAQAKDADFGKLARENSDDPGSKLSSGSLGDFTYSGITKEISDTFAKAAFALEVNGTSPVVQSPAGFHIIQRIK